MDIRIVNKEGNMIAVGDRTLRTNGKMLCLLSHNNELETIQSFESEEIAEGVKRAIVKKVKGAMDYDLGLIVIEL